MTEYPFEANGATVADKLKAGKMESAHTKAATEMGMPGCGLPIVVHDDLKFNQSMAGVATLRIKRSDVSGPTRCQWRNNTVPNATISTVLAPYGCVVLRYGNILEDDGTLMNQFGPITYDQSDVFILGPSQDEQVYQVHFAYHGLQYIWLSGLPSNANSPPLSMLTAHKTNTAVSDTGSVTTNHPVLNWIVHA